MQRTVFQRSLDRYIRRGLVTPREAAEVIGCTAQNVRAIARGEHHPRHPDLARLSSWLVDERGLTEHLEGLLGISGATHFHPDEVDLDDCLQDEIFEARQLAGEADELLKMGDRHGAKQKMKESIRHLKAALKDIKEPPD
jgi:predicted transcriptional regulator